MPEGLGFRPAQPAVLTREVTLNGLMDAGLVRRRRGLAERYVTRSPGPVVHYGVGAWAWLFNRVTGLVLVLYVFLHVATLLYYPAFYESGLSKLVTAIVSGSSIFHGLNGIRLILGDLGLVTGLRAHRAWIVVTAALAIGGTVAVAWRVWG